VLECVVNVSEGRRVEVIDRLAASAGDDLLDTHRDPFHNRSVFTLAGTTAIRALAAAAVEAVDLSAHAGVHPRLGVVDVIPFVPLPGSSMADALVARDEFAWWAADTLGVPCFLYGPQRSLPEVRRGAWVDFQPDIGPAVPHPTAGAMCVGARTELVAYNVWLVDNDLALAKRIAALVRGPHVRALGLVVGDAVQVSMNLVDPAVIGPAQAYDDVARHTAVARAELVGLIPDRILQATSRHRWAQLDLGQDRTIEWRLARRGK